MLAIIESEAPGRENLADCAKDDQFVYTCSFCIDIEMSDWGRRTCMDIAGNWIFIFFFFFFVKYSTFAAPELFTFNIIE